MGSYGVGITRIMAAAVEQNHDDDGIMWRKVLAPFEVVVILATRDHDRRSPRPSGSTRSCAIGGVDVVARRPGGDAPA